MAFENDPEGYRMAVGYAGDGFDKPRIVTIETLWEYSFEWTLDEFQAAVKTAVDAIPEEFRSVARVELADQGYDSGSRLSIWYVGPESEQTVADRVRRCVEYVSERRAKDRADYERLRAKFGPTT